VSSQLSHWRTASAVVVFVLAGSSAIIVAMHNAPSGAYQANALPLARPNPSPAAAATAAERSGRALLAQAAAACRSTAFSGIQVFRFWGPAGPRGWRAEIWHPAGGQTVAAPVDNDSAPGQPAALPGPSVSVVALSRAQLAQLQASYVVDYAGHGAAGGRAAELVTVDRPDGTLAAKYWLDAKTRLPLRRQLFDDHARIVSDISVTSLRTGKGALAGMPAVAAQPWPRQLGPAKLSALRAQGWPLPAELPDGMLLFAASATRATDGQVVALSYSDGLSVISIFVQRGRLSSRMPGWRAIVVAGHHAYAVDPDDQTIAWSSDGYVFTLLADAPATTVDHAIAALPQGGDPGLLGRLARGFRRLASWANPFH
jgi:sigma-E factor negative regulatory protein RseB